MWQVTPRHPPRLRESVPGRALADVRDTLTVMSRVYGDSTPFPHDLDYIHMMRDSIDCAVRLLSAQHAIRAAVDRAQGSERSREREVIELNALFERVQAAVSASITEGVDRTVRTAAQMVAGARAMVDVATSDLDAQVVAENAQVRHIMDKARETVVHAVEHFLERHAPPRSRYGLQVLASAESNAGQVTVTTPYDVTATFGVAIPNTHAWSRPRRVADFMPQLEIHVPKESGWLSKRVEMTTVRLDRMFISELVIGDHFGVLSLRRGAAAGGGYRLRVGLTESITAAISPLKEDGSPDQGQPLVLEGKDLAAMLGIWRAAAESLRDLPGLRRRLVSATFVDRPLIELESPRLLAEAMIADIAPTVVEISRRSGAPSELVLRRNLGEGRREETYCTHSELVDKIRVLPPDLRAVFAPLRLNDTSGIAASLIEAPVAHAMAPESPRLSGNPMPPPAPSSAAASRPPAMTAPSARPPSVPPPQGSPAAA
ncbi:MAG: hypothetical protein RL685_3166 [Pseudomonadota bacterium]